MSFEPKNYLINYSSWNSLRDYVINRFNLNISSNYESKNIDNVVINFIRNKSKDILLNDNEIKTFDRKIRDYKNNNKSSLSFKKANLYRLLFVLEISDTTEVLSFCRNVIHQQELSARSLDDFIALCCLKLHISYKDYIAIAEKYNEKINQMRLSDTTLVYNITNEHVNSGIAKIKKLDDLENYIDDHINEFAYTRNTTYLMLFSFVSWEVWTMENWINFFKIFPDDAPDNYQEYTMVDWDDFTHSGLGISNDLMTKLIFVACNNIIFDETIDNDRITEFIRKKYEIDYEKDYRRPYNKRKYDTRYKILEKYRKEIQGPKETLTIKDYYMRLFSIVPNGLSEEQIAILSKDESPFKNTFITYDSYRDLYLRKNKTEIKQGLYLLSYIQRFDYIIEDDWEEYFPYDYYADLFNPKLSIDVQFDSINENILAKGGFPSLCDTDMFNKLFMDVYKEVMMNAKSSDSPAELKDIFLYKLCDYLK